MLYKSALHLLDSVQDRTGRCGFCLAQDKLQLLFIHVTSAHTFASSVTRQCNTGSMLHRAMHLCRTPCHCVLYGKACCPQPGATAKAATLCGWCSSSWQMSIINADPRHSSYESTQIPCSDDFFVPGLVRHSGAHIVVEHLGVLLEFTLPCSSDQRPARGGEAYSTWQDTPVSWSTLWEVAKRTDACTAWPLAPCCSHCSVDRLLRPELPSL